MPPESTSQVRMELVVHRRMDIRGDLLVELTRPPPAEEERPVGDRRATHAKFLAAIRQTLLVRLTERLAVDDSLAVAPALVVTGEAAVVAIPSGDGALV